MNSNMQNNANEFNANNDEKYESHARDSLLSGLPKTMESVTLLEGTDMKFRASADVAYRASSEVARYDVNSFMSSKKQSSEDIMIITEGSKISSNSVSNSQVKQSPIQIMSVGVENLSKYQIALTESIAIASRRLEQFFNSRSLTNVHRIEGGINIWDCHSISDSCQLVEFGVRLLHQPDQQSVVVDFKRERGCCDAMSNIFNLFVSQCGSDSTSHNNNRKGIRRQPPPLAFEDNELSCADRDKAINDMSVWLSSNPKESLQSIGALVANCSCSNLIVNNNLFHDVCKTIKSHESEESSILVLGLGLSCLRIILGLYSALKVSSPLTSMDVIQGGVARASRSSDATVRREAGCLLEAIAAMGDVNMRG